MMENGYLGQAIWSI